MDNDPRDAIQQIILEHQQGLRTLDLAAEIATGLLDKGYVIVPRCTLWAERDEADRRAGAAERRMANLEDTVRKHNSWTREAKEAAGFDQNTSFDVVWTACLAAYRHQNRSVDADVTRLDEQFSTEALALWMRYC